MPSGSKSAYTGKQKRKAEHIEESVKSRGGSTKTAERIAWATVNKQDGGGKKRGAGRKRRSSGATTKRGAKKKSTGARTKTGRSRAPRKAARSR